MSKTETRPKAKPGSSLLRRIYAFFCSAEPRKTSPIGSPATVQKDELRPPILPIPKQYFQQLLQERTAPYSLAIPRESPIGGFSSEVNRPLMSLPIDASMLTWTQSVRRLNTEYRLTVTALEQVKDFIQSTATKEVSPVPMANVFARPRLVQRMDLNRFPVLAIIENDENDQLSAGSSTAEVRQVESESEEKPDCTLETITNLQEEDPSDDETEEETTYTVETFYGKANDLFGNQQQVVIVREEATEEQFNAVQEISSSTKPKETSSSSINDKSMVSSPLTSSESPSIDKTKKTLGTKVSHSTSTEKKPVPITRGISTERAHLLRWCQQQLSDYPNVSVTNLSSSWSDGLALCALVDHFYPSSFDFRKLTPSNPKKNFQLAFRTVNDQLGIPALLDPCDTTALFTYLHLFCKQMKDSASIRCRQARSVQSSSTKDREGVQ